MKYQTQNSIASRLWWLAKLLIRRFSPCNMKDPTHQTKPIVFSPHPPGHALVESNKFLLVWRSCVSSLCKVICVGGIVWKVRHPMGRSIFSRFRPSRLVTGADSGRYAHLTATRSLAHCHRKHLFTGSSNPGQHESLYHTQPGFSGRSWVTRWVYNWHAVRMRPCTHAGVHVWGESGAPMETFLYSNTIRRLIEHEFLCRFNHEWILWEPSWSRSK